MRRSDAWAAQLALVLILLLALAFRSLSLTDWDAGTGQHPDERFFADVTSTVRLPASLSELYDSARSPLNPRSYQQFPFFAYGPLPVLITRLAAVALTPPDLLPVEARSLNGPPQRGLDPERPTEARTNLGPTIRNPEHSLPRPPLLGAIFNPEGRNLTTYGEIQKVGRGLAVLFDLGSVVLVYLIGTRLVNRRVGLLAALLYALAVMPIQQSHFFVDPIFSAFFCMLALYWAVRAAQGGGWPAYALLGLSIGAAMASRITLATLGGVALVAGFVTAWQFAQASSVNHLGRRWSIALGRWLNRELPLLVLAGALTLLSFRTLAPDAFIGSRPDSPLLTSSFGFLQGAGFLDLRLEPRFVTSMTSVRSLVSGEADFPPSQQWVGRTAYVFPWLNMVRWGMGPALGLAAWIAFAAFLWLNVRRLLWPDQVRAILHPSSLIPHPSFLPLAAWISFYFLWQGGQFAITLRYLLPIYGALCVFAAWGLYYLWQQGRHDLGWANRPGLSYWPAHPLRGKLLLATPILVVLMTLGWAYAFTRIYTLPHSRVMAAQWFADNATPGSRVIFERWDDPLPMQTTQAPWGLIFEGLVAEPYAEDEPIKYFGGFSANGDYVEGLLNQLDRADYITLTSNRIYDSTSRLRMRYPALMRYYHTLFNGELGFRLAAEITSYPRILGVPIPDQSAEEAFHVYDHPRVLIFEKTPAYSRARAEALITDEVLWAEVYKSPVSVADRNPTALRLTEGQWPRYTAGGTWSERFATPAWAHDFTPLLWLLNLQLIGLAGFALLFRFLPHLPDRGYSLAKLLGLLSVAYLAWLSGSLGNGHGLPGAGGSAGAGWGPFPLAFSPATLWLITLPLLVLGAWAAWHERAALRAFGRTRPAAIIGAEAVFLGLLVIGLSLRLLNPDLWHPARGGEKPMDFAFLNAVLQSAAFPPYDPWHAGGYLNYYYFGFVLVGALTHLSGVVPSMAYNLAVATLMALTALGAWGLVYNLLAPAGSTRDQARERRAILAAGSAPALMLLLGNLAQAVWFLNGYAAAQLPKGRPEWAYWDATRIVPGTVNEFPFFTFLFGDLHAHMLVMPLSLAILGLALAYAYDPLHQLAHGGLRRVLFYVGLLGLLAGAIRATNTWDYPSFVGLAALTMALAGLRASLGRRTLPWLLVWLLGPPLLMLLTGNLLFLPFTANFATESSGLSLWVEGLAPTLFSQVWLAPRTTIAELSLLYGHWLLAAAAAALLLLWRLAGPWLTLAAGLLLALLWFAGLALVWSAPVLLGPALLLAGLLLWSLRRAPYRLLLPTLWLSAALGLLLLVELVTVKGDVGRMNTVFKFGLHSWMLFALSLAAVLPDLWAAGQGRLPTWLRYPIRGGLALLAAAALVYPLTATPARAADRWVPTAPRSLDGAAFLPLVNEAQHGIGFSLDEDSAALNWLQQNVAGTPIILEAHRPSYQWAGRVATFTGLPTLLGWEWHQIQQRSAVNATPVILQRQRAIAEIYNSPDPVVAAELLRRYGVEYVYVGGVERANYDPAGLAKFATMAEQGWLTPVFSQGQTTIYRVRSPGQPGVLTNDLLINPPEANTPPPLMLDQRVSQLPAVDGYAWNQLLHANSFASALFWLVWLYLIGLLGLPVAHLIFGHWRDGGVVWARLIGLIILGYAVWWPTSFGVWFYDQWGLLGGLIISLGVSMLALIYLGRSTDVAHSAAVRRSAPLERDETQHTQGVGTSPPATSEGAGGRGIGGSGSDYVQSSTARPSYLASLQNGLAILRANLRAKRRAIIWSEAVLLGGFVFLALVRALNPDLWHPIWGGEKPMEFGFLNAVLRSPVMPPYDPFFSDGYINYYYYGYFLLSLPIKLTGIAPAVGFNLAVVTLFALTLAGSFAIGAELTRRVRYGLLAAALVTLVGNLAGFFAVGWSRGYPAVLEALRGGLAGLGERLGDWYIGPSRVIPYTINEFPFFTFLFADLHPHMLSMPIVLLVVALGYTVVRTGARIFTVNPVSVATMLLFALSLGALAVTNSWDFPTYGLLTGLALIGAAWRIGGRRTAWVNRLGASFGAALLALGLGLTALVLYAPFFDRYWAPVGGIGTLAWSDGTRPGDYLILYGLFLAILVPVVIGGVWRVLGRASQRPAPSLAVLSLLHRYEPPGPWLAVGSLILLLLLALFVPTLGLRLGLAALLLASLIVLARRTLSATTWYAILLAWVAWAVSLGIELIYIRDHLAGGDWYRMNTVFKFGLHIWVLLALAAAICLPTLLRGLRRAGGTTLQGATLGMLAFLLALAAFYPLAATPSRIANRFPIQTGLTLDGIAFMDQASFSYDCTAFGGCMPGTGVVQIDLSGDAEAIRWLNANLRGTPVVVQSNLSFYRGYGIRIAANTGFPTVVSALHVNEQRDPAAAARRDRAVEQFFRDPDLEQALRFLATYQVDYVYVGALERAIYPPEGLAKFAQLSGSYLTPVFEHPLTTIYAVRGVPPSYARPLPYDFSGSLPMPTAPPPDPDLTPDTLAAIEVAQRANPTNGPLAFGLAERYRSLGRLAEAAAVLEPAARANPNDLGVLHLWGDILAEAGRYREAEEAYMLAAQADPSAGNWNKLGAALLDWGAYDKAELALTRALTADPLAPDPHYHLGRLYVLQGQPARALEALNTYLGLAPNGQWANAARQLRAEVLP